MNIIEAIKSGKRFKRGHGQGWIHPNQDNKERLRLESDIGSYSLSYNELLADDWEIEEEKIEITRSQLQAAYEAAEHSRKLGGISWTIFLKELGFKE